MANTVRAATVQNDWTGNDVDPMITVVRDRDLDMVDTVRRTWAFYRDRRPDAYGDLVVP